MVNDIQSKDVKQMPKNEMLKDNVNLEDQLFAYDADFWKNYNIIQSTPLQDRIRRDLAKEKESTLEEQFQS